MLKSHRLGRTLVLLLGCAVVSPAHAHFILLKPDSWLNEDQSALGGGAPQKAGPCGPGGYDDIQPIPTNGKVTPFHTGDTVHVSWQVTVPHDGYFRISLVENRADLKDPPLTDPVQCTYDAASVPTGAHDNVLMDGIDSQATMQDVTLPNKPCDKCTLQVIQIMKAHGPPNCIYYHCADIQILGPDGSAGASGAAGAGAAGAGAAGTAAAGAGAGGKGAAGTSGTAGTSAAGGSGLAGSNAASGGVGGAATGAAGVAAGGPVGSGATVTGPSAGAGAAGASLGSAGIGAASNGKSSGCAVSHPAGASSALALWSVLGFGLGTLSLRRRARRA